MPESDAPRGRPGRPAVTSAHALAAVAQRLFLESGFDETSIDDIARAAGIGRRTFFRYFASKADVLFFESPREVDRFRACLEQAPPSEPCRDVIAHAVLTALDYPPAEQEWARQRAQVVRQVPSLQAHVSGVVFAQWQQAARDWALARHPGQNVFAIALGHAVPAALVAAHEYWLTQSETPLTAALAPMLELLLPQEPTAG